MSRVKITLVVGVALLVAVGAVTLTHAPPRVVRVGVPGGDVANASLSDTIGDMSACQSGEALPAGVTGIRIALWAFYGAHVRVRVYKGSRVLTEGKRGADWTSDSVTVPVKPLNHAATEATLCFAIGPNSEPVILLGPRTPPQEVVAAGRTGSPLRVSAVASREDAPTLAAAASERRLLEGKVGVEYLAPGQGSWWSRVLSVARHMGLGRAYSGTWIALLLAALMLAVGALAIRLTLRELS